MAKLLVGYVQYTKDGFHVVAFTDDIKEYRDWIHKRKAVIAGTYVSPLYKVSGGINCILSRGKLVEVDYAEVQKVARNARNAARYADTMFDYYK